MNRDIESRSPKILCARLYASFRTDPTPLHEGKTLEFKRDPSSPAPALRTVVAFANSAGGRLVIGVEDRTRAVVGVKAPLNVVETRSRSRT